MIAGKRSVGRSARVVETSHIRALKSALDSIKIRQQQKESVLNTAIDFISACHKYINVGGPFSQLSRANSGPKCTNVR